MNKKNKLLLICASSIVILNCYNSTADAKNKSSAIENSNKITYIYVGKEIPKNVQNYHKSKEWLEYEKEQKLKKQNKNMKNKNKNEQNKNINQENKQVKKYNNIKQNKKKIKNAKYNRTLSNNMQNQQYNTNNVLLNDFIYNGIIYYRNYKFTYASQKVAPGQGLNIPGRHVKNGFVVDKDNYIVLGAHPDLRYKIFNTPFGQKGKVYDAGPVNKNHLNVYLE